MGAKTVEIIPAEERSEVIRAHVAPEVPAAEPKNVYFNGSKLDGDDNSIFINVHSFDESLTVDVDQGDGTDAKPDNVYVEFNYPE
jgi:hypothetical protein